MHSVNGISSKVNKTLFKYRHRPSLHGSCLTHRVARLLKRPVYLDLFDGDFAFGLEI